MNEFLKELLSYVESTKDFALEQAPDMLHQLVMFLVLDPVLSIFGILSLSLGLGLLIFKSSGSVSKLLDIPQHICKLSSSVLLFGISAVSYVLIKADLLFLSQLFFAPKIVLIEYLRGLLGDM